jgi:hypothetical protein
MLLGGAPGTWVSRPHQLPSQKMTRRFEGLVDAILMGEIIDKKYAVNDQAGSLRGCEGEMVKVG